MSIYHQTKQTNNSCSRSIYSSLSFVLGYVLASLRFGVVRVESFGGSSGWDGSFHHGPAFWNVTCVEMMTRTANHHRVEESWNNSRQRQSRSDHATTEGGLDQDDRRGELFDYMYKLIDSAVGGVESKSWRSLSYNVTGDAFHDLFRSALVKSLMTSDQEQSCNCTQADEELGAEERKAAATEQKVDSQEQEAVVAPPPPQRRIHDSLNHFSGLGRVIRKAFSSIINTGVPLYVNDPAPGNDVMVVYGPSRTLPDDFNFAHDSIYAGANNLIPADDAVKNCRQLSIIHVRNEDRGNCWAFVPGQESFHIQKWLRVSASRNTRLNKTMPLRLVARGYDPGNGAQHPGMPSIDDSKVHRRWLGEYLMNADELLAEILPIVERIAVNNKVIVMVTNAGQSKILLNFACAAKSRGLDISKVLVFVLDKESRDLVEGLGMAAYYNEKFFGALPSTDGDYADSNFSMVVLAKIMGAHLLSLTGYDFLLQDVDVFWYKDPLTFFEDPMLADPEFDIFFQDDVNGGIRFQPWRANSGFYFARSNDRTRMLFKDFVMSTDQLKTNGCDQQTLAEVMAEHVSLWGLRVKVFDANDSNYFPGGGHFHLKKDYMEKLVKGELENEVYIFHMNWNSNKKEKIAYMRQMGHWFVHDACMDDNGTLSSPQGGNTTMGESCCSKEALFRCQFRDKASIKPCHDSPARDQDSPSWW